MDLYAGVGTALGFLIAISAHEFVTHWFAARLGDPSPKFQQRISFDIRRHADPLGTYVAPALFIVLAFLSAPSAFPIGYGKSHAISPNYQKGSIARSVMVPLMGPITTFLLAAVLVRIVMPIGGPVGEITFWASHILVFLTALELLPIPGRDGGRVLARFLPPNAAMKMEELRQYEAAFLVAVYLLFPVVVIKIADPLWTLIFA